MALLHNMEKILNRQRLRSSEEKLLKTWMNGKMKFVLLARRSIDR